MARTKRTIRAGDLRGLLEQNFLKILFNNMESMKFSHWIRWTFEQREELCKAVFTENFSGSQHSGRVEEEPAPRIFESKLSIRKILISYGRIEKKTVNGCKAT